MTGRQHRARTTRLGRFVRGRRPDRNPLRRTSDRIETAVLALLVIAFLVGAPLAALAAGSWAHALAHRAQLAQRASWTQVTAVTLTAAPSPQQDSSGLETEVPARWAAPDGAVGRGDVPVPLGSKAGVRVRVWTTRDGQLTAPPLLDSQVSGDTAFGAVCGCIVVAVTLSFTWVLARRELDGRRMAAWDAEWRSAGPRWTTRA
jgi:hypothetical protein